MLIQNALDFTGALSMHFNEHPKFSETRHCEKRAGGFYLSH